jgi:hypothetical protein
VTGGEALYADMGISARRHPLSRGSRWCCRRCAELSRPGALLLIDGDAARQPFFLLAPVMGPLPAGGHCDAAAIIASQALISGVFSLTQQAIQLGYAPRLDIEHTSSLEMGQIYVPQVELGVDDRDHLDRHRLRIVERAGRGVRNRRHDDDGDHGDSAARHRARTLAMAKPAVYAMTPSF